MKTLATGPLFAAAMIFAASTIVSPTAAQPPEARTWCFADDSVDVQRIAGCTLVIQSGRENQRNLASAYVNRGLAYGNKGDFDRAIADYTQAIKLDPKQAATYTNRGVAYSNKGDFDRAIADYTQAIQLDPKDPAPYNNRGNSYLTKRDLDRAIADFTLAIKLDPKATTTYTNRGIAYRYQGDLDGAIADFTLAIKLDPKLAKAYSNRCWAYFGKGNNDQAIADCSQAIELNPKDPNGYFNRGRANLLTGVTAKALVDLNQARELDPKSAYTALWFDIANRRSNLPSGLSEAVKQIDMNKWPAPVIRLYLGQSTLEAVIAAADDPDATTKQGRLCEANFYGGELTLQRGATDEAMRLLRLAVTGCPKSFIEYDDAKAELKVLGASR